MTYLRPGPSVVKYVTTIPVSAESDPLGPIFDAVLEESFRRSMTDDMGRFLMDLGRGRSHLWGDNTATNPAVIVEQPDRVLWDRTREETAWWWLGEPEHDCDY